MSKQKIDEPDEADVWEDAVLRALEAEAERYEREKKKPSGTQPTEEAKQ